MTYETSLVSALQTLVAGRIYPDTAPQNTARPYITHQQIGGQSLSYVDDTLPDTEHSRVQINVWADTRLAARALIRQIEAALVPCTAFQARPIGAPSTTFEPDTKLYGALQDYSIWSPR